MIQPPIPAGIPDQPACVDCTVLPALPGLKGGHSVFNHLLHALIDGPDVQAAGTLPVPGAMAGKAQAADTDTAGALSLGPANLLTAGLGDAPDSRRTAGLEPGLPADADAHLLGAWPFFAQMGVHPVAPQEPVHDGLRAVALGAAASASLADGRQPLPSSLPVETDGRDLAGIAAQTSAAIDAEADPPRPIMGDVAPRPVQSPQPLATELHAPPTAERPLESAKTVPSREVLSLQLPFRAPGWDGELAQRIVWMAGRQAQWADISLNPPNLGNLEVHLSLKGSEVSAFFFSPHAAVREAIDDSLSRLREMLASAGINLGQAQVGQESFGERRGEGAMRFAAGGGAGVEPGALPAVRGGHGLVDLYV